MARECRSAWSTAEHSAASGSSGSRAAPPSSAPSSAPSVPVAPPAPPVPSVSVDTALLLSDHLVEEDDMDADYCPSDQESDSFVDAPGSPPGLRRFCALVPPVGAVALEENSLSSLPSQPAPLIGARCDTRYVYERDHCQDFGWVPRGPTKHATLVIDTISGRKARFDAAYLTAKVMADTMTFDEQRELDYLNNRSFLPAVYLPLALASTPPNAPPVVSWESPRPP